MRGLYLICDEEMLPFYSYGMMAKCVAKHPVYLANADTHIGKRQFLWKQTGSPNAFVCVDS